ncbi:MAG TPA: 16S rRNA (guanine(966)-N(2))-methyltransferase RsmD [Hyphomicrobiaceae bacterium]|jgi:16S rRNA (guanine966-N2)-methyltransferase|nr:16S rRNA (guanine(966)-N(2))-methyltransferase RsmD [Hyphomicrobiaceae bacterium]
MRIVGGRFGGRPLAAPVGAAVRPTSDRVREAIFNILAHGIADFALQDARVLDLFAGSGALGLEALSRGAAFCLFVEQAASARASIRRNVEALGLTGVTKIFRRDATDLGPAPRHGAARLAFLDPPYGKGLAEPTLRALSEGAWLAAGAVIVIEEAKTTRLALPPPYRAIDQRTWGDTQVLFASL